MHNNNMAKTVVMLLIVTAMFSKTDAQIKIGILPRLAPTELTKMFTPLANYLSQQTGQKVELVIPKDFDSFNQMLKEGKFEYAFTNPNIYIESRASLGNSVEPLAISVEKGTGKSFTGCFLVKKGSTIKKISDFKNKKIIFVDANSAGGYLSQIYTIKKEGLSKKDITVLPFAKKHTNVALAVQNGSADIGGIRTADFDNIRSQASIPDVQILVESASIPNWPFFCLPKAKKDVTEKIMKALLNLKPKSSSSAAVLKEANLEGFAAAADSDFNLMRKIAEAGNTF